MHTAANRQYYCVASMTITPLRANMSATTKQNIESSDKQREK